MGERNPFEQREVTSRRGGPGKAALSLDLIVATALDLLTREGLEGMSFRKIAAALETGPASLYVYVDDLRSLRALVCDRALADVKTPRTRRGDWRTRLLALLRSYGEVLRARPGVALLAMSTVVVGPSALRILEALLALLSEGGVDRATAAWAADLLVLYVTAIAAEQAHREGQSDWLGQARRAIGAVVPDEHPHVYAARAELLSGGANRFTWALDALLRGILETPVRAARARGPWAHKTAPQMGAKGKRLRRGNE